MARKKRDSTIENRSAREGLKTRREPYWLVLEPGRALGYRKGKKVGHWVARLYDRTIKPPRRYTSIGAADDFEESNGEDRFSFAQAQRKAHEWADLELERETGVTRKKGPFTVADAWAAYLRDCVIRGVKSLDTMKVAVKNHILPEFEDVEVAKLRQKQVEDWLLRLAESGALVRGRMGAASNHRQAPTDKDELRARKSTANRVLSILKAMLNHAKKKRLTKATGDAWREVRPFKGTTATRVRFLSPEEAQRLVNACRPDLRLLVKAAIYTGGRYSELARLQVQDFNPNAAQGAGTVFIMESKSGKSRHVVLTAEGRTFFTEVTTGRPPAELIFLRGKNVRHKRKEGDARAWMDADAQVAFSEARDAAKIGKIVFHELRHTYASGLVNAGIPLAYVAAQLGHVDTRMVEKHYGHLKESALADAIGKLAPAYGLHESTGIKSLQIKKA